MTKEEIIRMAREASNNDSGLYEEDSDLVVMYLDELERFAYLIAEAAIKEAPDYKIGYADGVVAEREACAKVCDDINAKYKWPEDAAELVASQWCTDSIRARKDNPV